MAVLTFVIAAIVLGAHVEALSPILIVPGLMGSQLFSRTNPCPWWSICYWEGLWVGTDLCFSSTSALERLSLEYNEATNTYKDKTGTEIKVSGFGETCKVEYLASNPVETSCTFQLPVGNYFHTFVDYFVARGYQRDKNIRAAPYDWRLAADQLYSRGYYNNLKSLIEQMYTSNGGRKVTLVSHSMGGPVTLFFLNNVVTQQWKNTYIYAFVSIAGAWSGGNKILQSQISGQLPSSLTPVVQQVCDFPSNLVLRLRSTLRSTESMSWLLPKPSVWGNTILVTTPKRSYTANDYQALFQDMGFPQGFKMYTGISVINAGFTAPNVPVYCFYGTDVQTAESFVYDQGFPDSQPTRIVNGNGDGTVNLKSAEVCLKWKKEQTYFVSKSFSGAAHVAIVQTTAVLQAVEVVVTSLA